MNQTTYTPDMLATLKQNAAEAAIQYADQGIIGVGTGSTVRYFIEALAKIKHRIETTVASSNATTELLNAYQIPISPLNSAGTVDVYVDGADEFNRHGQLIKGGGGALTREKVIAAAAKRFICIVDASKEVTLLGHGALPVEVIPMARSFVARQLVKLGGQPEYRDNFVTDNGNDILDVFNLDISQPERLEATLNNIPGVVTNGIFALNPSNLILIASPNGIESISVK